MLELELDEEVVRTNGCRLGLGATSGASGASGVASRVTWANLDASWTILHPDWLVWSPHRTAPHRSEAWPQAPGPAQVGAVYVGTSAVLSGRARLSGKL